MKKSQNEIINLANIIKSQADNLPEESSCGDDNTDEIAEMQEIARQLYLAAGRHIEEVEHADVLAWLMDEPSDLTEFLD